MATKKSIRRSSKKLTGSEVERTVSCWEDDPGDPKLQPPLSPITVPAPDGSAQPLPFKIKGVAPVPQPYQPGTADFLFYAASCALRRTADFWGGIVTKGTKWQVGKVLPVNIDSGIDLNAYYTRGDGKETPGLHFFHDSVNGRVFFSGESPDITSHEMGHAVLDAIRPQLFNAQTIESAAFHEAFGDMSAMLSALQVPSFRQTLLVDTGGKLNRSSRLSRLAEQLGAAIRFQHPDSVDSDSLRNAANSFFYRDPQTLPPVAPASQLSSEPHSFSRVFSGGFLDALAGMFKINGTATTDLLLKTSQDMAKILVGGVMEAPVVPDYYSQVAAHMINFAEGAPYNGKYRDVLKSAFVRRGILSLSAATTITSLKRLAARSLTAASSFPGGELPLASISAAPYGLKNAGLKVYTAEEPKRFAITSSSLSIGPMEPRSPQNAAESYTEDLFQRGRVDVGEFARKETGLLQPFGFKTHRLFEQDGELVMRRIAFDCGFDHAGQGE
jgi:hypothetical protein